MQILRDIYKLAGEEFRMVPNIYAIRGRNSLIFVDCGTGEGDWAVVEENLRYWGLDRLPISHVLITHAHFDHAGNAAALQARGAKIVAGIHADALETPKDPRNFYYAFHRPFPALKPDILVKDGDILELDGIRIEVLEAPGHTCGDVAYRVEAGGKTVLFLGDIFHIAEYGAGAWIGDEWFIDSDYDSYMASLYRLKDIHADVLLTGHMQGCLRNADEILQDAFVKAQERFDGRWDKKRFLTGVLG